MGRSRCTCLEIGRYASFPVRVGCLKPFRPLCPQLIPDLGGVSPP